MAALGNMLGAAVREGVLPANPVIDARRPRSGPKRIDPYTVDELTQLINHAAKRGYSPTPIVALLASCGCRVGEALGLDVGDSDPDAGTIHIHQTYDYRHGLGTPKSAQGFRTIRVPSSVVPFIREAIGQRMTGPLFMTAKNTRYILPSVRKTLKRMCRDLNIVFRKPHQLRHSVATALMSTQVPLGEVATFLGDRVETVVATDLHPTGVGPTNTLESLFWWA